MKFFTTAGPVNPQDHYFIPHRLNEKVVHRLIEQKKYFILHAPRQSGKTTAILQLVEQLNRAGTYKALYVNVESAQVARSNFKDALAIILSRFKHEITRTFGADEVSTFFAGKELVSSEMRGDDLQVFLSWWATHAGKPLSIFIDEIDSLIGDTLISVLRQLRSGYTHRPTNFPQSVCLIGVRDVRDYRIWSDEQQASVLGGSAFNIKAESLVMFNFSCDQVHQLYLQHTQETGQQFTDAAIKYAFEQTQGQAWLVNALAYEACFNMETDRSQPITLEILQTARETLIKRQDTHLDVLIDRLQEPRVRHIISDILLGDESHNNISQDDLQYSIDLGLINQQGTQIANPIYQEIIPRALVHVKQARMQQQTSWYVDQNGNLDMCKLLTAFTQFYRENAGAWLKETTFQEVAPHLLLMAFLQRIINGGGTMQREYSLGRKRVDLLIAWPIHQVKQRIVIELKILRGNKTLPDGLKQTAAYMDASNATEGHLVVFDRSSKKAWANKIYQRQESVDSTIIKVWGM